MPKDICPSCEKMGGKMKDDLVILALLLLATFCIALVFGVGLKIGLTLL